MKKILIALIGLLSLFPTYSQIVKIHKGDPFPYDTGAAVEIQTYRLIRLKTIDCDSLLSSGNSKTKSDKAALESKDSIISIKNQQILLQSSIIERKEYTIDSLSINCIECTEELKNSEPKVNWYKRWETWGGIATGFILSLFN